MTGIIDNYDEVSSMRFSQINIHAAANGAGEVNIGSFVNHALGMNSVSGTTNADAYKKLPQQSPSAGTGVQGMNIDSILSNALRASSKQGGSLQASPYASLLNALLQKHDQQIEHIHEQQDKLNALSIQNRKALAHQQISNRENELLKKELKSMESLKNGVDRNLE